MLLSSCADIFGEGQPLHPSQWCIHSLTICHVLCKTSSMEAHSGCSNPAQHHFSDDLVLLEDGEQGGPRIYSFAHSNCNPLDRVSLSVDGHKNLVCRNSKCKRFAKHCSHIQSLQSLLDACDEGEEERMRQVLGNNVRIGDRILVLDDEDGSSMLHQQQDSTAQPQERPPVSTRRISPASVSSQELMRKNPLNPSPWLPACQDCKKRTGTSCTHCVPDADGHCDRCGSEWNSGSPIQNEWLKERQAVLMGCQGAMEVSTYYRPCQGCHAQKSFDGQDVGIFNFSDKTLFLHELMFQYLDSMAHSKTTFTGFYSMLHDQYARSGCSELLRSRRVFGYVFRTPEILYIFSRFGDCFVSSSHGKNQTVFELQIAWHNI
jgi:hypothetical protein